MRYRGVAVGLTGLVLLTAVAVAADRGDLWRVVRTCALVKAATGAAFPCVALTPPSANDVGMALIKSPKYPTEFLVTPVTHIVGIESSAIQQRAATSLWQSAWLARAQVADQLGRALSADEVALAVNSAESRTQDQFHIHIDCVSAATRRRLIKDGPTVEGEWTSLSGLGHGTYLVTRLGGASLEDINVISLLAAHLPPGRRLETTSAAVVGIGSEHEATGFFLLARFDGMAAEPLLDHRCAL